jgi:hypothetical protein
MIFYAKTICNDYLSTSFSGLALLTVYLHQCFILPSYFFCRRMYYTNISYYLAFPEFWSCYFHFEAIFHYFFLLNLAPKFCYWVKSVVFDLYISLH